MSSGLFRRARVLIIDDDLAFGTLASLWFRHAEFQVQLHLGTEGSADAIDRSRADVVIVDYDMSGADGCDIIREARTRLAALAQARMPKFVLVAGTETASVREQADEAGANALVCKRDGGEALLDRVRKLVGGGIREA